MPKTLNRLERDLTHATEALRQTEQRLNTATQGGNIGLWEWDFDNGHLWFSDQWYRMLGLQPNKVPPSLDEWTALVHPDDRPQVKSDLVKHLKNEIAEHQVEVRLRCGDGSWRWFLSKAHAVERDEAGRAKRIVGLLMDIGDRRAAQERLLLATTVGNIGLWEGHLQGGRAWFSDQYWAMLGYRPAEMAATFAAANQLVHPDDWPRLREAIQTLKSGQSTDFDIEFRMRAKNGTFRWFHNKGQVVERAPDGTALRFTGVQSDVTERKEAERRLAAAERLESIGRLAAGVAHEINTPIQYVSDSVYFIGDGVRELLEHVAKLQVEPPAAVQTAIVELQQELPSALERVRDGLARVAEIVRSMKEFSHPDQQAMCPIDLNRAIQCTLVVARNECNHVADVKTEFGDLPPVCCYGGQINQVVLNLVINAAHAIADVVKDSGERGLITVKTFQDASEAVICVSDTGSGIPEAIHHRIFEPFFTTKEVGRGTGQGLSIARNVIVRDHGGSISFQTELGKGTTFVVRLPIQPVAT